MENEAINIQLASVIIVILGLLSGFLLLRLRDVIFGGGVGPTYNHIDFDKKIEEEENLNLDRIIESRQGYDLGKTHSKKKR